MDQDNKQKQTYFVAVKVFLEKDGQLLILKDNFGEWDLPGGRIKKDEFDTSLEQVVRRKMTEELGGSLEYEIGKPEIFMRHQRKEAMPGNPEVNIFALGYIANLIKGKINLSERHTEMKWLDINTFKPEEYFKGGWLKGVQEYLALRRI